MNTVAAAAHEIRAPGNPLELVLEHLRRVVRADVAALLSVDVDRSSIEPTATWFSSPALQRAVEPALQRPYSHEQPGLVEIVLERGRPLSLPRLEDWEAAQHVRAGLERNSDTETSAGSWEVVRHASVIACPVRTALGRTLGALVVASMDPDRPLRRRDMDIIVVLADLAALAHERSELMAVEAARGREELLLKRAAESTSSTLEPSEVVERIVDHGLLISGSSHARLTRLAKGSERLLIAAEAGNLTPADEEPPTSQDEGERAEVAYVAGIAKVARTRSAEAVDGENPSLHVPLALGPRLFGVLSLTRLGGDGFDRDDIDLVAKLAHSSAASMANALDFQHERKVAGALTQGFVPESLSEVPGWEVGVLYEPAQNQPTGGDVYGAWTLPSGEVALLVGDVAGKGLETAAMSAMARFFIEARSLGCDNPAEVLAQANTLLRTRLPNEMFVTAFLGFLGRKGMRYANAGHLAPLVLRAEGEISEAGGGELPLGIEERPRYEQRELELERGDILFAFTDGIIEARREGELLGEERLRSILQGKAGEARDPQDLARLVHAEVREWASGLSDDAAIVALRRRGLSVVSGP